jgi:hypothetical protein
MSRTTHEKGSSIVSFAQKPTIVEEQAEYGSEQYFAVTLLAEVVLRDSRYPNLNHRAADEDVHLSSAPAPFKHRLALTSQDSVIVRSPVPRDKGMQLELREVSRYVLQHLFEALLSSQEIVDTWETLKRTPPVLRCSDLQVSCLPSRLMRVGEWLLSISSVNNLVGAGIARGYRCAIVEALATERRR